VKSDLDVLEALLELDSKDVVDIGCGGGSLVRELAAHGAQMVGVEISEEQLAPALARDDGSGGRYLVGSAQSLPLKDASMDVVVFMRSLHHVPPDDIMAALREANRVLRPDGAVYVVEPLARGDYFELMRLVEDEVEAREAAQNALANSSLAGLARHKTVDYDVLVRVTDLAAFRARLVSVDPARGTLFDTHEAALAAAFERLGEPGEQPGERRFIQPMRADVLRRISGGR
jgi:ubiquinone/menaquinone biosynthesis C-methylase UbiE